jgi:hypothetical protein
MYGLATGVSIPLASQRSCEPSSKVSVGPVAVDRSQAPPRQVRVDGNDGTPSQPDGEDASPEDASTSGGPEVGPGAPPAPASGARLLATKVQGKVRRGVASVLSGPVDVAQTVGLPASETPPAPAAPPASPRAPAGSKVSPEHAATHRATNPNQSPSLNMKAPWQRYKGMKNDGL